MKKIIWLLCFTILLSSCYSYRTVNTSQNELVTGQRYKVLLKERRHVKGRFMARIDSNLIFSRRNGKTFDIPYSEVKEIKKAKFSIVKTIGFPVIIVAAVTGSALLVGGVNFTLGPIAAPN